jgi:hypothetical protein
MLVRGRYIAQAVSRRLPTLVVHVLSQLRSCGICGGKSGTEAGFHRVLRFSLPVPTLPTATYSLVTPSSTSYSLDPSSIIKKIKGKKWPQWHDICIKIHKRPQIGYEVISVGTHTDAWKDRHMEMIPIIMRHVNPLLGNDCEISSYTTAVAR